MTPTSVHADRQRVSRRDRLLPYLPFAFAIVLTGVLAQAFVDVPLSFIDVYSNLSTADETSWEATLGQAFKAGVEYRPLMTIATKLAYDTIGLNLHAYHALVLAEFALLLGALLWLWKPAGPARTVAAIIAIMCLSGLHSSRILFNFNPLNGGTAVLLLALLSAGLAMEPSGRRWEYAYFPIALGLALIVEFGLLLVPVLVALWLSRAPGITFRGVGAAALGAAVYVAIHLGLGAPLAAASHTHSGLGFAAASPERLDAAFGGWLWLFWIYNVVATFFTVAFSEPREGTYVFIDSILHGTPPAWMWLHVISSLLTTIVIVAAYRRGGLSPRDRAVTAIGVALVIAGSGLGFLYTRDRIAMPVGIGYAMLLYVALSSLIEKASVTLTRRVAVSTLVLALAGTWLIRDAELYWFFRDLAWEYHREWSVRYESIRADNPVTDLMLVLQAMALDQTPEDPYHAPQWAGTLLERKFGPGAH